MLGTGSCRSWSAARPAPRGRSFGASESGTEWRQPLEREDRRWEGTRRWGTARSKPDKHYMWASLLIPQPYTLCHGGLPGSCSSSPMRRSSSCRTSTASLTLWSGSVRFSQAVLTARGVISEKRALNTHRVGFTVGQSVTEVRAKLHFSHITQDLLFLNPEPDQEAVRHLIYWWG